MNNQLFALHHLHLVTPLLCLRIRLEVWRRVRPLRRIPRRVRPSRRSSWLPVTSTGPKVGASRWSGTVRCVISCRCRRSIHHGRAWDRSNNWGSQTLTHAYRLLVFLSNWIQVVFHCHSLPFRRSLLMALLMEIWMKAPCRTRNMTCWSLPRSTSDRRPAGKGEGKHRMSLPCSNSRTGKRCVSYLLFLVISRE